MEFDVTDMVDVDCAFDVQPTIGWNLWCLGHNLDIAAGLFAMQTLGHEVAWAAGYKEGLAAGKLAEAMNERRIILPGRSFGN